MSDENIQYYVVYDWKVGNHNGIGSVVISYDKQKVTWEVLERWKRAIQENRKEKDISECSIIILNWKKLDE